MSPDEHRAVLTAACAKVQLDATHAELIRLGDNALYRLSGGIVARVSRPGRAETAAKEVAVAQWLKTNDVPAVQAVDDIEQPIEVHDRAVTFWRELPPHHSGTFRAAGIALARLHQLTPPTAFTLPELDPFDHLAQRVRDTRALTPDQRIWLDDRVTSLQMRYQNELSNLRSCVVHGDAHTGNIVTTADEPAVFIDFERTALGPPEWDLVTIAVLHRTTGWRAADDYAAFIEGYGQDITTWPDYELFRSIRELRMTCYVAELSNDKPEAAQEATYRIACLQGQHGDRPWAWGPM